MTQPFYVTTPIYYVNDVPHLGHAYTTIVADALARCHQMMGDDVRYLTGTDEHGQKIQEAADKRGLTPQQLVDDVAPRFLATWRDLGLTFDNDAADAWAGAGHAGHGFTREFIRTTWARHKHVVQGLWQRILERNPDDLYLGSYEGWYCVGCEGFYTETQLHKDAAGGFVCPTHERPVQWVTKETSYFFRLSAYAEAIAAHIEAHPEFVQPEQYRNEVLSFVRGGLKDLSVSRTSFSWGIPVPDDARYPEESGRHVMYVWFDALTNYLSDLGDPFASPPAPAIETYWRQAIHVIGKDILRFHAVYWPAFLLAAGLPLPRTILCHGWWTIGGRKISKSIPATRVSAVKLAADLVAGEAALGTDALRYFLLRETPLGNDGDLIYENLIERTNADPLRIGSRSMLMPIRLGPESDRVLAASGWSRHSVPPAGCWVDLHSAANISQGARPVDVTAIVHPDNAAAARHATAVVGLDMAGIDFISPDIARSWREIGGGICDVNRLPGLLVHHVAEGTPDVASDMVAHMAGAATPATIPIVVLLGGGDADRRAGELAGALAGQGRAVGLATGAGLVAAGLALEDPGIGDPRRLFILAADPAVTAVVAVAPPTAILDHGLGHVRADLAILPDPASPAAEAAASVLARIGAEVMPASALADGRALQWVGRRYPLPAAGDGGR